MEDSVTRILKSQASQPELAAQLEKFRRKITVMFTDIKGSTAFFERFGDAAGLMMVEHCNSLVSHIAEQHGGRVIKTIGDSVMAAFEDNCMAIAAAIEMQRALTMENVAKPEPERVSIRIGLNYGPGIVKTNDVFGDVVNVASRVESAASPEQIVISDALRQTIPADSNIRFRCLGRFALKGKAETQDLYEVIWSDTAVAVPTTAHTLITADPKFASLAFKLQQLRSDGSGGPDYELRRNPMLIGRTEGDLTFPNDQRLEPRHARLSLEHGQLFVEPVGNATVFFSLVGPYRLQDGDVIRMGHHLFQFRENADALANAAASGTAIGDLARLLNAPPGEFLSLGAPFGRYAIAEEQVTFGRTKANYVFPEDMLMSRSHAKVYHRGEDFFLEDTGSRNGTFVKAAERVPLALGTVLSVGGQLLRVVRS